MPIIPALWRQRQSRPEMQGEFQASLGLQNEKMSQTNKQTEIRMSLSWVRWQMPVTQDLQIRARKTVNQRLAGAKA